MQSLVMTDPSIGSSSPNWASLISNGALPNFIAELPENSAQKANVSVVSSESPQDTAGGGVSGQMSPYAPVFHPMGSYASHLLALEQAAQINMQSLAPPSPRPMHPSLEDFYDRPEIFNYNGPKPMHSHIFHCPTGNWQREFWPETEQQINDTVALPTQPQHVAQLPPSQEYMEQQTALVAPVNREFVEQQALADAPQSAPLNSEYWREIEQQASGAVKPQMVSLSREFRQNTESQVAGALPAGAEYLRDIDQRITAVASQGQGAGQGQGPGQGQALAFPREYWEQHINGFALTQQQVGAQTAMPPLALPPSSLKQWQDVESQLTFGAPQHLEYWANVKQHSGSTMLPHEHDQAVSLARELHSSAIASHCDWWSDVEQKLPRDVDQQVAGPTSWWAENEQKVANVVAPQQQVQFQAPIPMLPTNDWWPEMEQKSTTVATHAQVPSLPSLPTLPLYRRGCHAEAEHQQSPSTREWWQAAAFTPQQQQHRPRHLGHSGHPAKPCEWMPYSYASLSAMYPVGTTSDTKEVSTAVEKDNKLESTESTSHPSRPSRNSSPSSDFPSFEDFAKQVSECSLSSSEYIATLRNLMIRAHNLMLPLLRGRFANMTQVQMAAYTTAILEVTPLHPSLFLPSNVPRPWTSSGGLYPPCHPHSLTPQDLSHTNPRPMLVNASTQTDYHCWCMHMSMYPPPPLHVQPPPPPPPPPRTQGNPTAHFAAPNGPRMMAPCGTTPLSFWGRPMVPVHAYPHAHQIPRPHGSRYGYRINTYSVPYHFGPVGSSRSRHMGNMQHGAAMSSAGHQSEDNASTDRSSNNCAEQSKQAKEAKEAKEVKQSKQLSSPCSSPSGSSVIHMKPMMEQHSHLGNSSSVSQIGSLCVGPGSGTGTGACNSSDSSSIDSKAEDLNEKETEHKDHRHLPIDPLSQPSAAIEDNSSNESPTPNRVIVKQVNNIFLQPTGPVMPTMPMMPMMHFVVSPAGGHTTDAPYMIYDMNDNYTANPNFAQLMPNINMNMNMNISMLPNSMHNVHVMSPDATSNVCQVMPDVNTVNPPIMVPISTNMTTFKPPSATFTTFDLLESGLNEPQPDVTLMQMPNQDEPKDEELSRNETHTLSHINADSIKESNINHDHTAADNCDQSISKLSTQSDTN